MLLVRRGVFNNFGRQNDRFLSCGLSPKFIS